MLDENKLVSIIVPVYNVEKYLKRCVDSITSQTYTNLEIILVDDGSTDTSGALCDELAKADSRIKVIHKENTGVADTRNIGLEAVTGERIAFVDSDDMVASEYIEYMSRLADESGCKIIQCELQSFSSVDGISNDKGDDSFVITTGEQIVNNLQSSNVVLWNKLYDRSVFADIKFPKGMIHEDSAVAYRIFDITESVGITGRKLYYYFSNECGITKSKIKNNKTDLITVYIEQYKYMVAKEKYKKSAASVANAAAASFGELLMYSKDRYVDYNAFQKALLGKYLEVRSDLLLMPLRRDLKICVLLSQKSLFMFKFYYRLKSLVKLLKK